MLQQTCPSLLSEFQFLITHIQAPFLPPTVHLRDCDGHHNFLADDLWYLFKQCLWAADAVNTVWMDDVYTSSARSCPAEIVGLRSVESNPSCCQQRVPILWQAWLAAGSDKKFFHATLSKAIQIEMGVPYLLPCAPCSAVILTESDPSKGPGQSKPGGQLAVQHSTFRPILMNFRPELRFWTVNLNFWTSCEYGGMIVSQFISSTWRHS